MMLKLLEFGLLTLALATPGVHAQTTSGGTAPPAACAVDPVSIQARKDMGAHLQSLKRFEVSTELRA